jgi:hypothetical protein
VNSEVSYVRDLIDAISAVLPAWLERCVVTTARRQGANVTPALAEAARAMARSASPVVMAELVELFDTDVDAQRTNPLSVLRAAVRFPTEVLAAHGVPARTRDEFAVRAFPADLYGLSPATWDDIDESLREPGLIWGAWKAKTVLDRRRAEGRLS